MLLLDNINQTVKQDLQKTLHKGSKVAVAAACFSIYAYRELKKELESVEELRFLFTSPTFTTDHAPKEEREFYIPRRDREQSLYGTAFEVRLRNELNQKAIARECADWIRRKVTFKSNVTPGIMPGFLNVDESTYSPLNGFTTEDLGCERGNHVYYPVMRTEAAENSRYYLNLFDELWRDPRRLQDVTDEVIENITTAYKENPPEFLYFFILYNVFGEYLSEVSEDDLPNEATGFKQSKIWNLLYNFQKDAALGVIHKLEQYNGCILADSVGLGKTFTALAVIKYYENRNKSVLVLCPKKLAENWNTFKGNYVNNPVAQDRLRYDVLFHTDLSRRDGSSNGIDLSRLNWGNYDLVVIDESHNFRNGLGTGKAAKENRYTRLMNQVIKAGVRTKVLMLSATPVNNRFGDLKNQLALAYEGTPGLLDKKLNTSHSINEIFRQAQTAYNKWSRLPSEDRSTNALLQMLDFDFFELLDSVTIARSRKHIETYYNTADIGKFPRRLPPISERPHLTDLDTAVNYNDIYEILSALNLAIYTPSDFILESRRAKYADITGDPETGLTQSGREQGIRRLMSINLLKRLESSVHAFRLTLQRIYDLIDHTLDTIDSYHSGRQVLELTDLTRAADFDEDDQNTDFFAVGKKVRIDLADMDYISWREYLRQDAENLGLLAMMVQDVTPEHDSKLQTLRQRIRDKLAHPINPGNQKLIVFTAFSDTADYLYANLSQWLKQEYGLETAEITGSVDGRTTVPGMKGDLNTVLTNFSPLSKGRDLLRDVRPRNIDLLIATDCISEGQNLQDCDYLINYDIHWNPVRIIQRFGRIDRIGSRNDCIQLVNFWPDMDLDEYINLKARVETRMKISVLTATGDDDLLNAEEKGDLEYRRQQLKRLQTEVVDLEEMSSGVSITDLGLNEFRMDLLDYRKTHTGLENTPHGIHAVVPAGARTPAGVVYVLRRRQEDAEPEDQNRLYPYYLVYVLKDGTVMFDHLESKAILDRLRMLCKGRAEPDVALCRAFNEETRDGRDMAYCSRLLSSAIECIMDVQEENDLDSLFRPGGTTLMGDGIQGLDDFELIAFVVVR